MLPLWATRTRGGHGEGQALAELFLAEARHYDDVGRRLLFQVYTVCFGGFALLAASGPIWMSATGSLYLLALPYAALGVYWIALHVLGEFLATSAQKHACHERALDLLSGSSLTSDETLPLAWYRGGGAVRSRSMTNWMLAGLFTVAVFVIAALTHAEVWTTRGHDHWVVASVVVFVLLSALTAFGWRDMHRGYRAVLGNLHAGT
ncbi:hypothetical protein [Aquipuribacter sp. SD81]|uniref:hypothetical protein n=1 Tax=Aquipuribacter sp. SD81 TaxID=3127703 RepID=UPI003017E39D